MELCFMSFYLSRGFLLCWKQNCGQNPAKAPSYVVLAVASRLLHGKTGSPCTSWGEHVRLDSKGEDPPSNMHEGRAATVPLALNLKWITLPSYWFFAGKHINLLELERMIRLLKRAREGIRSKAAIGTCGFVRGFGSRLKRTIELTKYQRCASKSASRVTSNWN